MSITRLKGIPIVASANLAAPAGSEAEIWNYEVPCRTLLVLHDFGNDQNVPANWGLVRWDISINGAVVPGFGAIRDQMGFLAQRQPCQEIRVPGGSAIRIWATQETGIACRIGVSFNYDLEDVE